MVDENARQLFVKKYLRGGGIEIGPGSSATSVASIPGAYCYYFDVRTKAEVAKLCGVDINTIVDVAPMERIPSLFPDKADFLLAFHVLEHIANPIQTLIEWMEFVKKDGILILAVPHVDYCPDKGRAPTTIEHILFDYLLDRGMESFESREHVYSFLCGWIDTGVCGGKDKFEVVQIAHKHANSKVNDIHWHTFVEETFIQLIYLSAHYAGIGVEFLEIATPYNDYKSGNEILCVCLMTDKNHARTEAERNILEMANQENANALLKLKKALQKVER